MTGTTAALTMFGAFAGGGVLAIGWPARAGARRLAMIAACAGSIAALALSWSVFASGAPWTLQLPGLLAPLGGVSFVLDRIGALFLAIVGFTGALTSWYGAAYTRHLDASPRGRAVHAIFNLFLAGLCLVPAAGNVLTFLLGWELMALSSYLLVVSDPAQEDAASAGLWYAVMTHAGFLALLAAFLMLAQNGPLEFTALRAQAAALPLTTRTWIFVLGLVAFGSKAGLAPLHVWLPRAHPAAPSHVSALMSAAMVKLGVYGLIRLTFDLLPAGPAWWGGLLLTLGVLTALTGVLYAVTESHLKRLLAYSTIENIGLIFVALGFALLMRSYGYDTLAAMGLVVCLLHTLNHACFKSLLFLGAGAVIHRVHATSLEAYGGLIKRMPQTAILCLVGALSLAALPPLNGFASEWLIFQLLVGGARHTSPELAIVLPLALAGVALAAGLAAVSAVRLFGITFLALPRTRPAADAVEVPATMRLAMAVPAIACVALGLAPTLVLNGLTGLMGDVHLPAGRMDAGLALSLPLVGSRLWPMAVTALLVGGVLLTYVAARARRKAGATIVDGVWNCGRVGQSARSEYTAASFAEPLKRVFTGFYRPTQRITIEAHPVSEYFVRSVAYRAQVAPWMESTFYGPVVRLAHALSRQARRLQAGSIHAYLAYLPAALLVLLLLSRWIHR